MLPHSTKQAQPNQSSPPSCYLSYYASHRAQHILPLPGPGQWVIGSGSQADFQFSSSKVSSRHCLVERDADDAVWVVDLKSTNGTYLNGTRILAKRRMAHQDLLRLGDLTLTVHMSHSTENAR